MLEVEYLRITRLTCTNKQPLENKNTATQVSANVEATRALTARLFISKWATRQSDPASLPKIIRIGARETKHL